MILEVPVRLSERKDPPQRAKALTPGPSLRWGEGKVNPRVNSLAP
jgi:hypothetical protein